MEAYFITKSSVHVGFARALSLRLGPALADNGVAGAVSRLSVACVGSAGGGVGGASSGCRDGGPEGVVGGAGDDTRDVSPDGSFFGVAMVGIVSSG